MADGFTTALALRKQEFDSHDDTWGDLLNSDVFDRVDAALRAGSIASTGGTTVLAGGDSDTDYLFDVYVVTGVLSSNLEIQWPAARTKSCTFKNETTGNFAVTVKVSGQNGVIIPQGDTRRVRCNGTDVVDTGIAGWGAAGGWSQWVGVVAISTNAYTVAKNNHIPDAVFRDGMTVRGFFDDANVATDPTFKYGGLAAKPIVYADGTSIAAGTIPADTIQQLTYYAARDKWHLPFNASSSSFTARVGLALGAVTTPGTLTDAATITWDMAAKSTDVSVILGASRTLGNPTNVTAGQKGRLTITQNGTGGWDLTLGSNFYLAGTTLGALFLDKAANGVTVFDYYAVSSSVILLTPVWRTNMPAITGYKDVTISSSLTLGTTQSITHGLGVYPASVDFYLQCITTDLGYSVGDRLPIGAGGMEGANDRGIVGGVSATNVFVKSCSTAFCLPQSGNAQQITGSRWSPRARVFV